MSTVYMLLSLSKRAQCLAGNIHVHDIKVTSQQTIKIKKKNQKKNKEEKPQKVALLIVLALEA
jgi:hypothetical protein